MLASSSPPSPELRLDRTACIQVYPKNPVNFNVDNVRVVKLLGGGLHNCSIVRGMVLKTDAVGSIKQVENAKVDVACGRIGAAYFRLKYLADKLKKSVDDEIHFLKGRVLKLESDFVSKSTEVTYAVSRKEEALSSVLVELDRLKKENSA